MKQAKLIMPACKIYRRICEECGKSFRCDGICGKSERMKNRPKACFCGECYVRVLGKSHYRNTDGHDNCPSRFGKNANPLYLVKRRNIKEKVMFT